MKLASRFSRPGKLCRTVSGSCLVSVFLFPHIISVLLTWEGKLARLPRSRLLVQRSRPPSHKKKTTTTILRERKAWARQPGKTDHPGWPRWLTSYKQAQKPNYSPDVWCACCTWRINEAEFQAYCFLCLDQFHSWAIKERSVKRNGKEMIEITKTKIWNSREIKISLTLRNPPCAA